MFFRTACITKHRVTIFVARLPFSMHVKIKPNTQVLELILYNNILCCVYYYHILETIYSRNFTVGTFDSSITIYSIGLILIPTLHVLRGLNNCNTIILHCWYLKRTMTYCWHIVVTVFSYNLFRDNRSDECQNSHW